MIYFFALPKQKILVQSEAEVIQFINDSFYN